MAGENVVTLQTGCERKSLYMKPSVLGPRLESGNAEEEASVYRIVFETDDPARAQVLLWMKEEWERYADKQDKVTDLRTKDDHLRMEGIDEGSWWEGQTIARLHRANQFGLNLHQGRQQVGKMITASVDLAGSAIRLHGDMPEPGHPGGYVNVWKPELGD